MTYQWIIIIKVQK